ncbi:MAG TPA: hypothetical protein IAB26_15640 [Candidatus Limivivens merdigallinarum]|uniref:histidine kinase n=1 Tax=Candidatus Limivivens merdigallinarum TaxID=2840859 RepID=A0A9D0ZXU4_9FIRM|nr:hypothetical protein [Candidatus Limivivens merdigallinarum]
MKRKLWHHICVLVILTVLISFAAAGIVIYRHVWKETGITLEGAGGFLTVIWDSVGWILGVLAVVLVLSVFFVNLQVKRLIEPINELNLEEPLKKVEYEELRPLLMRVDEQNRQIRNQMKELEDTGKLRREFSANVSHELKTPLMSISGYAEIMKNGMVRPEDMTEFAGRIYHEASRLTTLVEDIIELSRLDENESEMPFETVDISELTADAMQNLESYAKTKHISMSFNGEEEICIHGVHHLLYEMFFNLTDNAIKYNEDGGWVHVSIRRTPEGAEWTVSDNGIGIAKEDQERIFERFYRVDKSHSRETGGTGLGLSIVKHGAILHHADIELKSSVGNGTRISIRFPNAIENPENK